MRLGLALATATNTDEARKEARKVPRYNKLHQYKLHQYAHRQGQWKRGCRRDADSTTAKSPRRRYSWPGRKLPERRGRSRAGIQKGPPWEQAGRCVLLIGSIHLLLVATGSAVVIPLVQGLLARDCIAESSALFSGLSRVPPERQTPPGMTPMAAACTPQFRPRGWSTLTGRPRVHPGGRSTLNRVAFGPPWGLPSEKVKAIASP